jgi:DNA-binding transcriptional regulator YdaS (Cro superfamily)
MACATRMNQMPKGKTPLTAAEITMIENWIKGP